MAATTAGLGARDGAGRAAGLTRRRLLRVEAEGDGVVGAACGRFPRAEEAIFFYFLLKEASFP